MFKLIKHVLYRDVLSIHSLEFLASSLRSAHANTEWRSAGWYRAPEINTKFLLMLGLNYIYLQCSCILDLFYELF